MDQDLLETMNEKQGELKDLIIDDEDNYEGRNPIDENNLLNQLKVILLIKIILLMENFHR